MKLGVSFGVALALLSGRVPVGPEPALPQEGAATIETTIDTAVATVGDRIWLTVTVEHERGTSVAWPDSIDVRPFEVVATERLPTERVDDRLRSRTRIGLAAFELGELEIPSFSVTVTGTDSTSVLSLATEPQSVTVVSVGRDESGDIRGIKGPLDIPRDWLLLLPWIAVIGAAVGTAWWIYRRRLRKGRAPTGTTAGPPRPPHEIALEALDRLERSDLLGKGAIKTYYIEVSDIVRTYIEGRFRVEAMEMASYEVLLGLESAGADAETRLAFERFFRICDLVKFAKHVPDLGECGRIVPEARALVEATRVREVAVTGTPVPVVSAAGGEGAP